MIYFKNPILSKTPTGKCELELTDAGTWEQFPTFAKQYIRQIGATFISKIDGPDVRIWEIKFKGRYINLSYNDFPNGISVSSNGIIANQAVRSLFEIAKKESCENGF